MDYLSFSLSDEFVNPYKNRKVNFGFPIGGGNTLGEIVFYTNYSRIKVDGTKERWWEVCRRCIEGMFSILKDHCAQNKTYWNELKAQKSAEKAYERMFTFKWTPPGRGLWAMGTEFVHKNRTSGPLQNCAFVSTEHISSRSVNDATLPFRRMLEMCMNGIGVGFDTRGAGKIKLHQPSTQIESEYVIPDTREGWADALAVLLESFFFENRTKIDFDYSQLRDAGTALKSFGGVASGPDPLRFSLDKIYELLSNRDGEFITSRDIVDIMNLAGKAAVAGGTRRSAEIAFGAPDDKEFLNLKNWVVNPERMDMDGWGGMSNNSIVINTGDNVDQIFELIAANGEPGILYLDMARKYGRLIDPPNDRDYRVQGANPCNEQSLEHNELCCLVETYLPNHDSLEDYKETLKYAYLYGKAVTLMPTPWPESNEVMQRNRRIGCSVSGVAQFVESSGWTAIRTWLNAGYDVLKNRDRQYSEWLGVRESIKMSSVKPSGSVSLLANVTPGGHWPTDTIYIRRLRFGNTNPILKVLEDAGYKSEPDVMHPNTTMVVELPAIGPDVRTEKQVSMWEKTALAVLLQRYWADNQVSFTCSFKEDEKNDIGSLIKTFEGQLKGISFLPITEEDPYPQMPYETIDIHAYEELIGKAKTISWAKLYKDKDAEDAVGEKYCNNDTCELKL